MADPTYTYTWGFQRKYSLEYVNGGADNGLVTAVHWDLSCQSSDGYSARSYGKESFEKGESVIPFEDLTKSIIIGWIKTKFGAEEVTRLENHIKNKLDQQRTPTLKTGEPTSWSSS